MFPIKLIEFLNENRVSTILWATSAVKLIAKSKVLDTINLETVNKVFFAGETMYAKVLNEWRKHLPDITYVNLYGPTEITVDCSYYIVNREFADDEVIPIGSNCSNMEIMLAVYLSNAIQYNYEADGLYGNLHGKIDKRSLLDFYSKYLFLNPYYGIEKIKAKLEDSYLQNKNDVFVVETGVYDKSKRDIEPIGSINEYYESYPVFTNYPYMKVDELSEMDNCLNSIAELKSICNKEDINTLVKGMDQSLRGLNVVPVT